MADTEVALRSQISPIRGGLTPLQTKLCLDYLNEHFSQTVSLMDLAAIAKLSAFHFARQFKATTGMTPLAYQRMLRCSRAKELLAVPHLTITEIAGIVGYETQQAFWRMFRSQVGVSPSMWRQSLLFCAA